MEDGRNEGRLILVSGATGQQGGAVARSLLEQIAWLLVHAPSWGHESVLRRSAQEGSRGRQAERDG
jgi:NAD(P)-dependent dehydrogenase (short-subunit alcohol dehydrogenase family)